MRIEGLPLLLFLTGHLLFALVLAVRNVPMPYFAVFVIVWAFVTRMVSCAHEHAQSKV